MLAQAHESMVHSRRVRVLAARVAAMLPRGARVLDVGCGDGLLASLVLAARPDVTIDGLEVLVRPGARIPVTAFDGQRLPVADASYDVVLFVDVLHHTDDPMVLLREAARASRNCVVIKDHLRDGFLAGPTLRFMDYVGNAHHGVRLPYNYWPESRWRTAFKELGLTVDAWETAIGLYPFPASVFFGRGLHVVTRLTVGKVPAQAQSVMSSTQPGVTQAQPVMTEVKPMANAGAGMGTR